MLREKKIDLVTVNRKLDRDYTDGIEVVKAIKADPEVGSVPVMLVTNYEEHQETAMQEGCVRGFGKLEIGDDSTRQLLEPFLGKAPADSQAAESGAADSQSANRAQAAASNPQS